MMLILT